MKWCSLSYEESTWELQEDVDPVKIREFEDLKKIPEIKQVVSTQIASEWYLFSIFSYKIKFIGCFQCVCLRYYDHMVLLCVLDKHVHSSL